MALAGVEAALVEELDRVRRDGVTPAEMAKAKTQLKARIVFDNDSVTHIAHQLGYFETIGAAGLVAAAPSRIDLVTIDAVARAAREVLAPANRTIGWFEPLPVGDGSQTSEVRS